MHRGSLMATHMAQPEQRTAEAAGAANGRPLIDLAQIKKAYRTPAGDVYALKGIDLKVEQGEFVGIVGKSGAGKSTLVNMVTGIDKPTSGRIRVGPHAVHEMSEDQVAGWRGRNVGVIFQFFQLLPMLTVAENVMLPMDFAGLYNSPKERRERALHLLEQVEIAEHADKLPSAVSGGQRQRVAIARALANDPMFLAADEPTGNLDSKTAEAVFRVFEKLVDEGKTILMVTHDMDLASRVTRTVHLADGELLDDLGRQRLPRGAADA
jgi:ABC-type lipoprotein export system ATPase subunit